jgi:uncharacterized protein (DUF1499 family)
MIDFATLTLPASPNTYLIAPPGLCRAATPHEAAPVFAQDAPAVRAAFAKVAMGEPRVTAEGRDDAGLADDYVQRSALMRFPDTISVRFIPLEAGGSTLALYSRSKVGYSDMGVNKKRVQRWMTLLKAELGAR